MNNSLKSFVDSASSILILLPNRPFLDQVAAGLSLYLGLRGEKDVSISCPAEMLVEFNRLVGINKITKDLGSKNLVISFAGYNATDVERVSYDIENGEFRLTVIPKPQKQSPTKEQLKVSHSGMGNDAVILVGGGNESHFSALKSKEIQDTKIAHIGTRSLSLSGVPNVVSLASLGSSCSEVVASALFASDYKVDSDMATNLLTGIEEGSRGFKGSEVTANTFEVFAKLMKLGGRRGQLKPEIEKSDFPEGSMPEDFISMPEPPSPALTQSPPESPPTQWYKPKIYKGGKN